MRESYSKVRNFNEISLILILAREDSSVSASSSNSSYASFVKMDLASDDGVAMLLRRLDEQEARYQSRMEMMEAMLRWRLVAPTAPDTLWCYPFQDGDAFVIRESPHVYFVGNQPKFETTVIEGPVGQRVRMVAVPKFRETGEVILMDMETLETEIVKFEVFEGG